MSSRGLVRDIAGRIPRELRQLRGRLMLEVLCETLGVEEVRCPACGGSGWLDRQALERCPLCCGFQEVPDRLADWFGAQFRRAIEGKGRAPDNHTVLERVGGERWGRLAEVCYRVQAPGEF